METGYLGKSSVVAPVAKVTSCHCPEARACDPQQLANCQRYHWLNPRLPAKRAGRGVHAASASKMKAGRHVLALDRSGHCCGLKPALLPSPPLPFQTRSGITSCGIAFALPISP